MSSIFPVHPTYEEKEIRKKSSGKIELSKVKTNIRNQTMKYDCYDCYSGGNVRVYQDTRVMQKMEEAEFFNNERKRYLMFD